MISLEKQLQNKRKQLDFKNTIAEIKCSKNYKREITQDTRLKRKCTWQKRHKDTNPKVPCTLNWVPGLGEVGVAGEG